MQRFALSTGLLVATTALVRGEDCLVDNEDLSQVIPPYCSECAEPASGGCKTCRDGFYLVTGTPGECLKCDTKCKTCTGPNTCTKCSDNFLGDDCKPCAEVIGMEGCGGCTNASVCTKCSANFKTIRNKENKITECKRNGATLAGSATLAVLASFAAATLAALI